MSQPDKQSPTSTMPEHDTTPFDAQHYLDQLVAHPEAARDRVHSVAAGEGMLFATAMSRRLAAMPPDLAEERFVSTAVQVLSGRVPDQERLETGVATLMQLWDGYISPQTESLLPAAIHQRMQDLPRDASRYHLTSEQAQRVSLRFASLTAASQSPQMK